MDNFVDLNSQRSREHRRNDTVVFGREIAVRCRARVQRVAARDLRRPAVEKAHRAKGAHRLAVARAQRTARMEP